MSKTRFTMSFTARPPSTHLLHLLDLYYTIISKSCLRSTPHASSLFSTQRANISGPIPIEFASSRAFDFIISYCISFRVFHLPDHQESQSPCWTNSIITNSGTRGCIFVYGSEPFYHRNPTAITRLCTSPLGIKRPETDCSASGTIHYKYNSIFSGF